MAVKRVTLALDVWQSLLHMRWQFRDLTFWQLQAHTNTPIQTNDGGESLKTDRISDLFTSVRSLYSARQPFELPDPFRSAGGAGGSAADMA